MNRKRIFTMTFALAIVLTMAMPVLADGPEAVAWLKSQQNADGGFGSPDSTVGATADVLLAVASTGENAIGWSRDGNTTYAYLEANAASIAGAGNLAKAILGLIASGKNPRQLGGLDLVAKLEGMAGSDGRIGGENDFLNEHCLSVIALRSAQRTVPAGAAPWLLGVQIADGSWSWNGDTTAGSGDNNTAAMAVVALVAAGVPADNTQIQKTLSYLHGQQNEDGGFPYVKPSAYGTDSDSNSTAVVMWAIEAAGQDPAGNEWKVGGRDGFSPLDKLSAFQNESGAFRWQDSFADDNFMSTVQAIIAIEIKTLPFATMDVGEPDAPVPTLYMPTSGANTWAAALALLGSGTAIAGAGAALRLRKRC